MLIVAIPKSASTSLLYTLGKLHGKAFEQRATYRELPAPAETQILHFLHSDLRDYKDMSDFADANAFFKQHIPPTANNLALLAQQKKVIQLRDPEEIILAYKRGVESGVHKPYPAFEGCKIEADWIKRSQEIGLVNDLEWFHQTWLSVQDANTLHIDHKDLMEDPKKVINSIERFFDLTPTQKAVALEKARYSGKVESGFLDRIKRLIK